MKKYFSIIQITWQKALAFRFSIVAYRTGEVIEIIFVIIMWLSLYKNTDVIYGYTLPQMVTYLLIGNIVTLLTRNFMTDMVSREIKDGTLSLFALKPITYFQYAITREFGRVSLPFIVSATSQAIILFYFRDKLIINTNYLLLITIGIMVSFAFVTELLLSYLIGLLAFWTDEVDGIFSTVTRLKKFLSGGYFPISLLPLIYVKISTLLPFSYTFFIPTQLYLNKISFTDGLKGLGIQSLWIVALYSIIAFTWKKGMKRYEGVGI